ncbi:MAG TPA: carboxypeptidase-like regulatory domain-containing protein, partial [Bacteroidales bacterium]|nr:carboxypeptidase-like regulatory domain-containing protein [Bacteroidales bacterium]
MRPSSIPDHPTMTLWSHKKTLNSSKCATAPAICQWTAAKTIATLCSSKPTACIITGSRRPSAFLIRLRGLSFLKRGKMATSARKIEISRYVYCYFLVNLHWMKQIKYLKILFLLLIALHGHAQTGGIVKGKVTSEDKQPIELANIRIEDVSTGVVSAEDGSYRIVVPANRPLTLIYSFLGFTTERKAVNLKPGQEITLDITLRESHTMISGPVVEDRQVRTTTLT